MAAYSANLPFNNFIMQTAMFALGSTLIHSAACVLNDICDRDFDGQVERTKHRPLVTGAASLGGAITVLLLLVCASVAMLATSNASTFIFGLVGIFPLHGIYPLMKRWTWWPQAWLGLAMNWGLLVGWISATGTLDTKVAGSFFLGTVCWTIVYDTIYACQDRVDDVNAGVKSTALLFGSRVRPILCIFATAFIGCMTYSGLSHHQGPSFFVVSIGGTILFFLWQFSSWKVDDAADCGSKFEANGNMGIIVWIGLFLDYYMSATRGGFASSSM
ncbi:UbiA prenyltransferase family [Mycena rebaudengoi]|nr:UbiA prenyltransferase family [Mycena rebaudengoi]